MSKRRSTGQMTLYRADRPNVPILSDPAFLPGGILPERGQLFILPPEPEQSWNLDQLTRQLCFLMEAVGQLWKDFESFGTSQPQPGAEVAQMDGVAAEAICAGIMRLRRPLAEFQGLLQGCHAPSVPNWVGKPVPSYHEAAFALCREFYDRLNGAVLMQENFVGSESEWPKRFGELVAEQFNQLQKLHQSKPWPLFDIDLMRFHLRSENLAAHRDAGTHQLVADEIGSEESGGRDAAPQAKH